MTAQTPTAPYRTPITLSRRVISTGIASLFLLAAASSHAQIVWTGLGADNSFFTSANWNKGTYTGSIALNTAINSNLLAENASITTNGSTVAGAGYTFTFVNTTINSSGNNAGFLRGQGSGTDESYARSVYQFVSSTAYLERVGVTSALHLDSASSISFTSTSTIPINANSVIYLAPEATITFLNGISSSGNYNTLATRIVNSVTGRTLSEDAGAFVQTGDWSTGAFSVRAIPEPGSAILLLAAASGIALLSRRSRGASRS